LSGRLTQSRRSEFDAGHLQQGQVAFAPLRNSPLAEKCSFVGGSNLKGQKQSGSGGDPVHQRRGSSLWFGNSQWTTRSSAGPRRGLFSNVVGLRVGKFVGLAAIESFRRLRYKRVSPNVLKNPKSQFAQFFGHAPVEGWKVGNSLQTATLGGGQRPRLKSW